MCSFQKKEKRKNPAIEDCFFVIMKLLFYSEQQLEIRKRKAI